MNAKQFLSENREVVINYYNTQISSYWTISLADFMADVLVNFRKVTKAEIEGFRPTDLTANLNDAKNRLGLINNATVVSVDYKTESLQKKYAGTAFMKLV